MFLFYTTLLMGAFTRARGMPHGPTILSGIADIITPTNFMTGLVGAIVGYFCIDSESYCD